MRAAMQQTVGNLFPFGMEEMGRQNMAMMERAMSLFAPFYRPEGETPAENPAHEIEALREEVRNLRAQLAAARATPPKPGKAG
jgi:polyhydroxyalkanoate synthesis regulator protein